MDAKYGTPTTEPTKPALTSTRSLDEGFESDPDRFSTSSSGSSSTDDTLRSGRRTVSTANSSSNNNSKCYISPRPSVQPSKQKPHQAIQLHHQQPQQQHHRMLQQQQATSTSTYTLDQQRHPIRQHRIISPASLSHPNNALHLRHNRSTAPPVAQSHARRNGWPALIVQPRIMVSKVLPRPTATTVVAASTLPSTASQMLPAVVDYRRRVGPNSTLTGASNANNNNTSKQVAGELMRSKSVDAVVAVRSIQLPKVKMEYSKSPGSGKYGRSLSNGSGNGNGGGGCGGGGMQSPGVRLSNTGSLYTFYPAEGNISLQLRSNYGLTYKSSHLNVQSPAPVSWTQSVPRQQRRYG